MEPQVPEGQSLNDIQNYLVNFNKEISAGGQTYILASSSEGATQAVHGQAGFVVAHPGDQLYEDGTSALLQQEGIAVPKTEDLDQKMKIEGSGLAPDQSLLEGDGDQNMFSPINIAPSAGTVASTAEPLFNVADEAATTTQAGQTQLISVQPNVGGQPQLVAIQSPGRGQQVVAVSPGHQGISLHDSSNQEEGEEEGEEAEEEAEGGQDGEGGNYQTVTIVPSEVNQGGEVSYVLIVSQNDQEQKINEDGNTDMSVYDFKEEARGVVEVDENAVSGSENVDAMKKGVKTTPKKQQGPLASNLMCNYCNYTSPKRYLLTRHMKTHSEERPHKCHICDRGFKTVASLQNHINTHTGVRPHKCKECDAAFTTSGELVRHVRYRHTYEKPHKCPECDYASVELSKLKRHMRSHTGERPYQCPHCVYASPDTYKLKRHLRIHTGEKPYECDICHTRFTQSNSLKAHKLIHTGNKPIYQCELCPTTCGRKTDLKIHVQKLHTSEKPLQCKKCGKSFPDRYTWKIHVKTHEGEKCFKCELCPYAALSQRHLESHLLTHTGEKPFECDECEQTFRQKQLLRRHKNLYHTPDYVPPAPKDKIHECAECGKAFAHKGNLLRHRAGHDPDNLEYQEELANYRLEKGEEYNEEEEEEEEEELDEDELDESGLTTDLDASQQQQQQQQQVLVTQAVLGADGQNYQAEPTGQIHMANINGQQVQLQLVHLNDENNTQVYIQIDNNQQLQSLMGQQAEEGEEEEEGQAETDEQVAIAHQPMETDLMPETLTIETPPTGTTGVRGRAALQHDVKQEDVKQEVVETRDGAAAGNIDTLQGAGEGLAAIGKHRLEGSDLETPTKRTRRDSPRRLTRSDEDKVDEEEEEAKRQQQKKKDIETCFGFEDI